jgi:hypothetical protein
VVFLIENHEAATKIASAMAIALFPTMEKSQGRHFRVKTWLWIMRLLKSYAQAYAGDSSASYS